MNYYSSMGFGGVGAFGMFAPLFLILMLWSLYWKGRALWLSARKGSLYWFIALLVINTVGILEILYIYFFSKKDGCGNCAPVDNETKKEKKEESVEQKSK